jgi:hypothetical protein
MNTATMIAAAVTSGRSSAEAEARSAAQLQWTLNKAELSAYRCEICSGWHLARTARDG